MKKTDQSIYGQYAASYYEVMDLAEKNQEYIYDVGAIYNNPFESFFPQTNCIALADTSYYTKIDGMSARHINEFRWLDQERPETIYPENIEYLANDEVVLALTIDMVRDICYALQIERTVTALSRYLQIKPLKIYFDFRNDYWQYSDQQMLNVVGFSLERSAGIYHFNHMWNEYMFEEKMRFPSSDDLSRADELPWMLKKIYYFYVKDNVEGFLAHSRKGAEFDEYILEIANKNYYQWLYKDVRAKDINRILVFANTLRLIPARYYRFIQEACDDICHPIYGSYGGYAIYPSSMMYGFSNFMYFSSSQESLDETIDINTTLVMNGNEKVELPEDVMSGHYSQSISGGVNFSVYDGNLIEGSAPKDLSEIAISKEMAKKLYDGEAVGKELHVAYLYSQSLNGNGDIYRTFNTTTLLVTGVVDSDKNSLFHEDNWSLSFFQVMLDVSAFNLGINAIMVDAKDSKNVKKDVEMLKKAFPDFAITEPMSEINESVNKVCSYIEIALASFSIIAVIISTMLLSICNYLYVFENRKDIGLVRCIGVNKRESKKFVLTHSLMMCLGSFVLSSFELLLISIIISKEMANQMGNSFSFSFEPMALVYMFVLAFAISMISSLIIANKINKLDPISALKS